jgi:hypothetical protein
VWIYRRNTQRPLAAIFLGYFYTADRLWVVAARGHPIPQLVQIVLQTLLKAFDRLSIDPSAPTVALDQLIRFPQKLLRNLVRFRFFQSVPPISG